MLQTFSSFLQYISHLWYLLKQTEQMSAAEKHLNKVMVAKWNGYNR